MRSGLFFMLIAAVVCLHLGQRRAYAQPAPKKVAPAAGVAPKAAPAKRADDEVKEEQGILYVIDPKTGELRSVLAGFTPKEVDQMIKAWHARAEPKDSPFEVGKITLRGIVRRDSKGREFAELQCKMTLQVGEDEVRVPLDFSGWIMGTFKHPDQGDFSLARDEKSGGYVCRIRAAKKIDHVLEFSLVRQLRVIGGERRLRLNVPPTAISNLTITAPLRAEGRATGGTLVETTHSAGKSPTTEFSVIGLERGFQLSWNEAGKPAAKVQQIIKVEGEIVATIDELSVRHVAKLTLQSESGATFRIVRVRLPKGAKLESSQPFEAKPVGGNGSDLYDLDLRQSTQGPIDVTLATTQTRKAGQPVELGGFEVVPTAGMSISRQGGVAVVHVVGDWKVVWSQENKNVERVDAPEHLNGVNQHAAFSYMAQPFSLAANVRAKKKVVRVEPHYLLDVGEEEIRLQAKMRFHVRGRKTHEITIDMPGWDIDESMFGPADVVNVKAISLGDGGRVVVPLTEGKRGDFKLTFTVRRKIDRPEIAVDVEQETIFDVNLPEPHVDSLIPAVVAVIAADNVNLKLDVADRGLASLALPPPFSITVPKRQQPPLFYRADAKAEGFHATISVHDQQIETAVESDVTRVGDGNWQVSQKLIYRVQYKSTSSVTLDVPRALLLTDQWEIDVDGEVLPKESFTEQEGNPDSPFVPILVELPNAKIGRFELICRFPLAEADPFTSETATLVVPLVMPSGLPPVRNELQLVAGGEIQVNDVKSPWTLATESTVATDSRRSASLTSVLATHEARFSVHRVAAVTPGTTNVERAWIQSWFTGPARRDRVVFRFTSRGGSVRLTLPEGVIHDKVQATLSVVGGEEITELEATRIGRTSDGKIALELLPVTSSDRRYVLELVYRFADRGPGNGDGPGSLRVAVPQFDGQIWVRRLYWQLVLPENEHVVFDDLRDLTPEFSWGWRRLFWGRQPLRRTEELELWSGAKLRDHRDQPSPATSQYLYSAAGPRQELVVHTMDRSWIVGAASLMVLVAGLLLIYLPAARRSGVLFLVAVALVAMSWWAPSTSILLAQAASVGLVLALMALWLVRSIARAPATGTVAIGGASSIIEISTTQLRQAPVGQTPLSSSADLAQASTATALTASQPSTSDSHQ